VTLHHHKCKCASTPHHITSTMNEDVQPTQSAVSTATVIKKDNFEFQELNINLPNNRSFSERLWINTFGECFRGLIDSVSLPLYVLPDKYRFTTKVSTGKTGECRVLVFVPKELKDSERPRGVVMHLHGGGWTISRPETEAPLCRYIADKANVVVISPDYWKAPLHPYPFALEQCYQILTWVATGGLASTLAESKTKNAALMNIDSSRIGVSGGSSGSNLACSLATMCVSRPLPNNAKIVAQALLYPALNLSVPYEEKLARVDPSRTLPPWMSRFFLTAYLPPPRNAADPYVSPALASGAVIRQLPPTIILTAAYDYLAHEADEYAGLLAREGVPVTHRRFEDVGHGFDGIPTRDKRQRMLNHAARDEAWGLIARVMESQLE